ncbi:murein biosynthesis integral membrane protein MurJ [Sedimenticola selenatireducens]|uniref:Probable lipid II flippase MurJ n=1 Tax=Sedimenticola selenatireducens TaxID=191960 RepID=A0A2N6CSL4_9GAMM|nr:murein biosynthesis integral membrane protein MurJ [Sedimenticola selenatireducens]PLX60087.1 MAG: murein biosynthesis integral membrane protein MurJ [Sedimenticola selenatireducens]
MFRSLAKVGSNTLLSRILGFVRDLVVAHTFGANAGTDAFFVAFKIPNFLRRLFAEGAFAVAFVPVLTEYKERRSFAELKRFVDHVAGTLGAVLLAVTLAGVLGAPVLAMIFAPGFIGSAGKLDLAVDMLRLTFPYLLFISLTAFAGGILNAHGRFGIPAFTPVLLNVSLISSALWLAPQMDRPIMALAWGVLLAGILQLLFQFPFLRRIRLLPRFVFAPKDDGVRRIGRLMLQALFGVSVTQLNLLLDTLIASFLVSGSISWLYYYDRLMEFPLGILGVGLATVILPNLSKKHATESPEGFSHVVDWALRWGLLLGLPSAVGLFVLAGPMIATLFQSELFDATDVAMSRQSLMAYSLGLLSFILIKVLAPGYYSRQDTRTPVRIAVIAMVANMVMNIILVFPLAHAGLALATSLSATLNAFLLYRGLRREGVYQPEAGWPLLILRGVLASAVMGGLLYWGVGDLASWLGGATWDKVWRLLLWVLAGVGSYFAALALLGIGPRHFRNSAS